MPQSSVIAALQCGMVSPEGTQEGEDLHPDAGKDCRQEEKGTTGDGVAGWHHRLDGHEFEQAPGVGDGQGRPGVLQAMGLQRIGRDRAE